VRPREILRVLPKFLELGSPVPVEADADNVASIDAAYRQLLSFYEVAYRSYGNDRETWAERRFDLEHGDTPNAYYDWFLSRE
jgi:hypothetical protein